MSFNPAIRDRNAIVKAMFTKTLRYGLYDLSSKRGKQVINRMNRRLGK